MRFNISVAWNPLCDKASRADATADVADPAASRKTPIMETRINAINVPNAASITNNVASECASNTRSRTSILPISSETNNTTEIPATTTSVIPATVVDPTQVTPNAHNRNATSALESATNIDNSPDASRRKSRLRILPSKYPTTVDFIPPNANATTTAPTSIDIYSRNNRKLQYNNPNTASVIKFPNAISIAAFGFTRLPCDSFIPTPAIP
mmetsp:Transcript_17876/g.37121  ORF Transcript_17876/g.37121 Transcript_17876/m.37121 type:complete len:211 (-) Transcript_17876:192-824(-)